MRGKAACRGRTCNYPGITPACAGKRQRHFGNSGQKRDHPRVCGEKTVVLALALVNQGSPPRVRGKGCKVLTGGLASGITPACAGKRKLAQRDVAAAWDHPRVCGEKNSCTYRTEFGKGSPPRVRGKDNDISAIQAKNGITPACAGKRSSPGLRKSPERDHPRVCGEKS